MDLIFILNIQKHVFKKKKIYFGSEMWKLGNVLFRRHSCYMWKVFWMEKTPNVTFQA